jgi:transcriptional regulator with XRE-family HTH domain/tetratricopeptide (TPR) repeat protein
MSDARTVGENIAYHRKRLGLSQVEFAAAIGRSESWVSQVERGVRGIDRVSVLQTVADALGVSVAELKGEPQSETSAEDRPEAFEMLRLALTGHPAPGAITNPRVKPTISLHSLRVDHARVWPMVHESKYSELAPVLANLITELELWVRQREEPEEIDAARPILTDCYQAAAAALSKLGDGDAAWIAADRAAFVAESTGSPHALYASLFRMAHVFLSLGQLAQVQKVASDATKSLKSDVDLGRSDAEELSLYGAFHLVLAVTAARENQRVEAHAYLDTARDIAARIGEGRNDFGTEFSPTNVALHAVSVAVELGDAGQALEIAQDVDSAGLSPERQARYLIDLAAAYAMRRQIGDATKCLAEADALTPEQTRTHRVARDVTRDLLQLSGVRVRPELRELAERFGLA